MEEPHSPQAKRLQQSGGLDGSGGSVWESLSPEILSLIFVRIQPADEMIRLVPFVCKSWDETVAGPYCWAQIDVQQWARRCNKPDLVNSVVRKLVRRSNGTCHRLFAYKLSNAAFSSLANWLRCLKVLQMPMSDVTDQMVTMNVKSLKLLTFLDISYCLKITGKGLEILGEYCTSLVHLKRNMPPPEWQRDIGTLASKTDNGEALAIADTMPALRHLELGYGCFTDFGLDAILTKCKNLTHLDIIGCISVKLEGDYEDKCNHLVVFRAPWDDDYEDTDDSDSSGDSSDSDSDSDS